MLQFDRQFDRVQMTYRETQTLAEELNRIKRTVAEVDANLLDVQDRIDRRKAAPWPAPSGEGDTIWMGAADANGIVVSYIQSIFWEYGSGLVPPGAHGCEPAVRRHAGATWIAWMIQSRS